jgi:ribosomal protein S12 methylthiotransferase accessory factor
MAGYAAERALTELVQTHALTARTGDRTGHRAVRRLAGWPALQRCALLPVRRLLAGGARRVALRTDTGGDQRPEPALDQVGRLLRGRGIDYHVCQLAPPGSLISVATTIAPGLERFSLVRLGVPVVPTGRGWRIWAAGSSVGDPWPAPRTIPP